MHSTASQWELTAYSASKVLIMNISLWHHSKKSKGQCLWGSLLCLSIRTPWDYYESFWLRSQEEVYVGSTGRMLYFIMKNTKLMQYLILMYLSKKNLTFLAPVETFHVTGNAIKLRRHISDVPLSCSVMFNHEQTLDKVRCSGCPAML